MTLQDLNSTGIGKTSYTIGWTAMLSIPQLSRNGTIPAVNADLHFIHCANGQAVSAQILFHGSRCVTNVFGVIGNVATWNSSCESRHCVLTRGRPRFGRKTNEDMSIIASALERKPAQRQKRTWRMWCGSLSYGEMCYLLRSNTMIVSGWSHILNQAKSIIQCTGPHSIENLTRRGNQCNTVLDNPDLYRLPLIQF